MRWLNKSALILLSIGLILEVGCAASSQYSDAYPAYATQAEDSYGGYAAPERDEAIRERAPMPMAAALSDSPRSKRSEGRGAPPNQQQPAARPLEKGLLLPSKIQNTSASQKLLRVVDATGERARFEAAEEIIKKALVSYEVRR